VDKYLIFVENYPVMLNSDNTFFLHGRYSAEAKITDKKAAPAGHADTASSL
jgi:hypothetical protein